MSGFTYILTNDNRTVLYVGVTSDLARRLQQHADGAGKGFTWKYNCKALVYVERFENIDDAIQREKQIKGGSRKKKVGLIESMNPEWRDLAGAI